MRKAKSDSVSALIAKISAKKLPAIDPPGHMTMRDCDQTFWGAIIAARSRDEWTDVSLVLAVQLARTQADIEREGATMDTEGSIVNGLANPRVKVIDQLVKREQALMRSLRMAGDSMPVKKVTLENHRRLERSAATFDDDLLA